MQREMKQNRKYFTSHHHSRIGYYMKLAKKKSNQIQALRQLMLSIIKLFACVTFEHMNNIYSLPHNNKPQSNFKWNQFYRIQTKCIRPYQIKLKHNKKNKNKKIKHSKFEKFIDSKTFT